jgi:hypothetical protein
MNLTGLVLGLAWPVGLLLFALVDNRAALRRALSERVRR